MAELGLAAAQTLLAAMDFLGVKEKCAIWGYESELADLEKTVNTIKNVLKDFQGKELNEQGRGYIQDLKDAVYDADDLFDELATRIELKELEGSLSKHTQIFKEVSRFFSSDGNQLSRPCKMHKKVKEIESKLNRIANDRFKFVLDVDNEPIRVRREETCSYINVRENIIGRDVEKNEIIDKLLRSENEDARFFTIVGMGGMGKTALAKLVFHDEKVKQEFGNSMHWVCVSDQDRQKFDPKAIISKIVEVATGKIPSSLELIQNEFQKIVEGKKYLLVLDDVWNENREDWVDFKGLLPLGQEGSRVLITTRSERTARIIGDGQNYMLLQGLSLENSRRLFEMTAFTEEHHQQTKFIKLAHKIVDKCCNNPLAIKVVGSLLYGQDVQEWKSFEKSELAKIKNSIGDKDNKIMSVLKFSYHNLEYPLKCCFTYCAVFPKDYELERRELKRLWMAQGYIVPSNGGQSLEDAAEEYFSILLRRCFFQDVNKDEDGDVESVKIHDLMHDVAQEVGEEEIQVLSSAAINIGNRTRHVSVSDVKCFKSSSNWTNLRSVIRIDKEGSVINLEETKVRNWRSVRVLDLKHADRCGSLESIGRLQHLRYLNLSFCSVEELPRSVTKLHNLETLILYVCLELKQLPHGFNELVKLRELDVDGCTELICMPMGMDKLTRLRVLPYFVVGKKNIGEKQYDEDDELKVLGTLTNLTGRIRIDINENYRNAKVEEEMSEGYLSKTPGLKQVIISNSFGVESVEAEAAMEKLQPHQNLEVLSLWSYKGRTIPRWGRAEDNWAISLPNLVRIDLNHCWELMYLPSFSKLPHLKSLDLCWLTNLKYMEKPSNSSSLAQKATDATTFFPSLVSLEIDCCFELKGWFWEDTADDCVLKLMTICRFPCLSKLKIKGCCNLTSFPPCPFVKDIDFEGVNKTAQLMKQIMMDKQEQGQVTVGTSSTSSSSSSLCLATLYEDEEMESSSEFQNLFEMCASSLRKLQISWSDRLSRFSRGLQHLLRVNKTGQLMKQIMMDKQEEQGQVTVGTSCTSSSSCLATLRLSKDDKMKSLAEFENVFEMIGSSLWKLEISDCKRLSRFSRGLQHLTALQVLTLEGNDQLNFREDEDSENNMMMLQWKPLQHSLRYLRFEQLANMRRLPKGMQYLTSLTTLTLARCEKLQGLPEWISCLSSLQSLSILHCPAVESVTQRILNLTSLNTLNIWYDQGYRLDEKFERKLDGEDLSRLQHIPNVNIHYMYNSD